MADLDLPYLYYLAALCQGAIRLEIDDLAVRQVRASNFDFPVAFGLQIEDRSLKIG